MAHVAFDTLQFVEILKEAGIPENQAKAFSRAQNEALTEAMTGTLATKTDIQEQKQQIADVELRITEIDTQLERQILKTESKLTYQILATESSLTHQIFKLESSLKQDIGDLRSNQKLILWMLGFVLTSSVSLIIKAFFT
jgi:flagellar biosynthesis/type III secretory pathway protein FliH